MSIRAPSLFLGHGSPLNVIKNNPYKTAWAELAGRFPRPEAIVCVSAHWETDGSHVTSAAHPRTIHDFQRFPQELFDIQYNAPGAPALAERISGLTGAQLDANWGLDHGAWGVLRSLYPGADVPILQFSLDRGKSPAEHYELGKPLAPLRNDGVMILGSGNIVHNLRFFRGSQQFYAWADRFDKTVIDKIQTRDHTALIDYGSLDEEAHLPVPTNEHYLPLLYVIAAQDKNETARIFNDDVLVSISMTSVAFGI
jgi:4,5-DOPA dioxygenase extradiol